MPPTSSEKGLHPPGPEYRDACAVGIRTPCFGETFTPVKSSFNFRDLSCCEAWRAVVLLQEKRAMADAATSQDAGPDTPALGAPEEPPMTPHFGATSSSALAAGAGGVVLSETQLGSMALRAKQQRTKAEQDKQLLQVRPYATHWAPPARSLGTLPASKWCSLSRAGAE